MAKASSGASATGLLRFCQGDRSAVQFAGLCSERRAQCASIPTTNAPSSFSARLSSLLPPSPASVNSLHAQFRRWVSHRFSVSSCLPILLYSTLLSLPFRSRFALRFCSLACSLRAIVLCCFLLSFIITSIWSFRSLHNSRKSLAVKRSAPVILHCKAIAFILFYSIISFSCAAMNLPIVQVLYQILRRSSFSSPS